MDRKERKLAQSFLTTAAKGGNQEAAQLLERQFSVRDYLPKEPAPKPEPKSAAISESPEELFETGQVFYDAEQFGGALTWFEKAAEQGNATSNTTAASCTTTAMVRTKTRRRQRHSSRKPPGQETSAFRKRQTTSYGSIFNRNDSQKSGPDVIDRRRRKPASGPIGLRWGG